MESLPSGVRVVRKLAETRHSRLFVVEHPDYEEPVLLKQLHPDLAYDPVENDYLLREYRVGRQLDLPRLPEFFCYETASGLPYILMQFIEGEDLFTLWQREAPGAEELLRMVGRVAEILDEFHRQGFVHRDVKPENIMIDPEGEPWLIDFGLALHRDLNPPKHEDGHFVGTLPYAAPERLQASSEGPDPRSDVYSLGVILHLALAGRVPFTHLDTEDFFMGKTLVVPKLDRLRDGLAPDVAENRAILNVYERALHPDLEHRFPHALAVAWALELALADSTGV